MTSFTRDDDGRTKCFGDEWEAPDSDPERQALIEGVRSANGPVDRRIAELALKLYDNPPGPERPTTFVPRYPTGKSPKAPGCPPGPSSAPEATKDTPSPQDRPAGRVDAPSRAPIVAAVRSLAGKPPGEVGPLAQRLTVALGDRPDNRATIACYSRLLEAVRVAELGTELVAAMVEEAFRGALDRPYAWLSREATRELGARKNPPSTLSPKIVDGGPTQPFPTQPDRR